MPGDFCMPFMLAFLSVFPHAPHTHSLPIKSRCAVALCDQSPQLPATWLTTSCSSVLKASQVVPAGSWSSFFHHSWLAAEACLVLSVIHHSSFQLMLPNLARVPAIAPKTSFNAQKSPPGTVLSVFLYFIHHKQSSWTLPTIYFLPLSQKNLWVKELACFSFW